MLSYSLPHKNLHLSLFISESVLVYNEHKQLFSPLTHVWEAEFHTNTYQPQEHQKKTRQGTHPLS